MASNILFPPVVDSYINTFQVKSEQEAAVDGKESYCKVYFSLADFNADSDFTCVQAVVYHKNTNKTVVNKSDDEEAYDDPDAADRVDDKDKEQHWRTTGIILDLEKHKVPKKTNLYYVNIYNRDLNKDNAITHISPANDNVSDHNENEYSYKGWIPGEIYKIQLRLSPKKYVDEPIGEEIWLNENAGLFSQQSRTCVVKPIGHVYVEIPVLDFNSDNPVDPYIRKTVYASTLDILGKFYEYSGKEKLYSFNVQVYEGNDLKVDKLLEDSGEQFTNNQTEPNEFKYLCKTEFKDLEYYTIKFKFTTQNQFIFETQTIIMISLAYVDLSGINIYTVEDLDKHRIPTKEEDPQGYYDSLRDALGSTSVHEEQEEGRVGLKLFSTNTSPFYGSFYLRRASSKDDFKYWYDIKLITLKDTKINNFPIIYDYTIESGVQYKYGIQYVDRDGYRGIMYCDTEDREGVKREFEYSYLLGPDNQQLKLMFNNTMQNYKIQVLDSKTETIGAKYPRVTRNGAVQYKIFPIEGLISTWMDENKTFCTKKDIYKYEDVVQAYQNYDIEDIINLPGYNEKLSIPQSQYNYTYERDFRDKVFEFLHDGKPKLFKSPTEGNVIVRLMDINCTPVQSLDRMLYSFTSNGNEIADNTVENYIKYHFIDIGDVASLSTKKTLLGQIQMEFNPEKINNNDPNPDNIFEIIWNNHNRVNNDFGGYTRKLLNIHHVRITFEDAPLRIQNNNGYDLGNKMSLYYNGNEIIINVINSLRIYTFDERLSFTNEDQLILYPPADGREKTTIKATVDYLYDIEEEPYVGKKVISKKLDTYLGQFYERCKPGQSIYREIANKQYMESKDRFIRLNTLSSIEIEAQPGMVIQIRDQKDLKGDGETHVINKSGILNLSRIANVTELKVKGFYEPESGSIIPYKTPDQCQDVMVNYHCTIVSGVYDVEV